jgi:hypothetical protein
MPTPLFAWACTLDIGEHAQAKAAWACHPAIGRRAKKLFHKRPSALHGAAGSLARRENAGAYARWARLPTALSPVLKQLLMARWLLRLTPSAARVIC